MLRSPFSKQQTLVFVVLALHSVVGSPVSCPGGQTYYEELTNRRECCFGICNDRDNKSMELCKEKCPGVSLTTSPAVPVACPPGGLYFNESAKQQMCCANLCSKVDTTAAKSLCKSKCPGYDSEIKMDRHSSEDNPSSSAGPSTTIVAAIVSVLVIIVISVAVLLVWVIRRKARQNARNYVGGDSADEPEEEKESLQGKADERGVSSAASEGSEGSE